MYWYWSQRDDLASAVKRHINAYVKSLGYFPERKELLNYMNSEQFFEFINQIDVPHINAQKKIQQVILKIFKRNVKDI